MDCKDQPIKEMINNIPDFREYESEYDNILDIEEKSQIPEAISSYFSSLRALVGKNSAFENLNVSFYLCLHLNIKDAKPFILLFFLPLYLQFLQWFWGYLYLNLYNRLL